MIDAAQPILLLVIIVLAFLLLVLGIQVFFILRELRQTITKANKVLDDTGVITESVSKPISSFSSVVSGIKAGASFANFFKSKFYKDESEGKKNKD
ncbi:MAG: hypothetical protein M1524_01425 [Patescibacteria group bacterium]|nr:hypothetical protein [Patescibacteria group bacterium]